MKINKIPGIVVLLTPFVLFALYLGISWWWEWVNCDTRNNIDLLMMSSKDKMNHSIALFVLVYIISTILTDLGFEKRILSYPFYIMLLGLCKIVTLITLKIQDFVIYINKHLTINLNNDER